MDSCLSCMTPRMTPSREYARLRVESTASTVGSDSHRHVRSQYSQRDLCIHQLRDVGMLPEGRNLLPTVHILRLEDVKFADYSVKLQAATLDPRPPGILRDSQGLAGNFPSPLTLICRKATSLSCENRPSKHTDNSKFVCSSLLQGILTSSTATPVKGKALFFAGALRAR